MMNEKIIELALKAGIERASSSQRAEVLEFAKLIVQECVDIIEYRAETIENYELSKEANYHAYWLSMDSALVIRKTFGIEK